MNTLDTLTVKVAEARKACAAASATFERAKAIAMQSMEEQMVAEAELKSFIEQRVEAAG